MKREMLDVKHVAWARNFCLFAFAFCLALPAQQAFAFKITEPVEGGKLTSGTTVTTGVDLGKDSGIVQVRYYWYGEQDDTLVCLLYTSPSPRDRTRSRMPSSA